MFFLLFPIGLDQPLRHRGIVCYMIVGMLLLRVFATLFYPELGLPLARFLPSTEWDVNVAVFAAQSLISPARLSTPSDLHALFYFISLLQVLLFWLVFGAAMEDRLGRIGLAFFYVLGGALGALMIVTGDATVTDAFWLGHASALFALGACYAAFSGADMKFQYMTYIVFFRGYQSSGVTSWPAVFMLVPMHLTMMAAQSFYYYQPYMGGIGGGPPVTVREGTMDPWLWSMLLPVAGAGVFVVMARLREALQKGRGAANGAARHA